MHIRRIFCIGRNYAEHVRELGNVLDQAFVVFMKPATCAVPPGVLPLPRGRGAVHHEAELVVMVDGGGAGIPQERALSHVCYLTLGLDLTLRELQGELKKKGLPWELAKAFDGAAPLGEWKPYAGEDLRAVEFTLRVNGALRQHGRTADMLFPVERQIHLLSQTWALQPGDIIYTGTPAGVAALAPGDHAVLESAGIGRFEWECV